MLSAKAIGRKAILDIIRSFQSYSRPLPRLSNAGFLFRFHHVDREPGDSGLLQGAAGLWIAKQAELLVTACARYFCKDVKSK